MIPNETLSTVGVYSPLVLEDPQPSALVSRQIGGVGLNNATEGLSVQIWTATLENEEDVTVSAPLVSPTVLFSRPDISQISLAFDQNMQPFIAFVEAGQAKFYWYDTVVNDFVFTDLPSGSTYPRATLDDHRVSQNNTSDIILVYIRDGNLYYRQQRDRYLVEKLLYADINLQVIAPRIKYVAMNMNWRLQILVEGIFHG